MAAKYRPVERIRIDWGGDPDHPAREMTDYVRAWRARWGLYTDIDQRGPVTGSATGRITVDNSTGRFDPFSPHSFVDSAVLQRRSPITIEHDGVPIWRGQTAYGGRSGSGPRSTVNLTLAGRHINALESRVLVEIEGGTLADLGQHITDTYGVPISGLPAMPIGQVWFEGELIQLLDNVARYGGGWIVETSQGSWVFVSYADAGDMPSAGTLSLSYGPLDGATVAEQVDWVRNTATLQSTIWAPDETPRRMATQQVAMPRNATRVVDLRFVGKQDQRPDAWTDFSATPASAVRIAETEVVSADHARVTLATSNYIVPAPLTATVSAQGRISNRALTSPLTIQVTEGDTIETHGEQSLRVPPWWAADYSGAGESFVPWLRNLSQPPGLLRVTYPVWQNSLAQSVAMRERTEPGIAAGLTIVDGGQAAAKDVLVVGAQIERRGNTSPDRTVWGVERRAIAGDPLSIAAGDITNHTAVLSIGIPTPSGENLFVRWRASGGAWSAPRTIAADAATVTQYVTGLARDTLHQAQVAFDGAFITGLAATQWRTTNLPDTTLSSITIQPLGAPAEVVSGVDLRAGSVPGGVNVGITHTLVLPRPTTATIAAVANDNAAVVVVAPSGALSATDGDRPTWTITVTNGGQVRVYTVAAPVLAPTPVGFDLPASTETSNGVALGAGLFFIPVNATPPGGLAGRMILVYDAATSEYLGSFSTTRTQGGIFYDAETERLISIEVPGVGRTVTIWAPTEGDRATWVEERTFEYSNVGGLQTGSPLYPCLVDDGTLYIAFNQNASSSANVYFDMRAWRLSDGARTAGLDRRFTWSGPGTLRNPSVRGCWLDGSTLYATVAANNFSGTLMRIFDWDTQDLMDPQAPTFAFPPHNINLRGLTGDADTLYLVEDYDHVVAFSRLTGNSVTTIGAEFVTEHNFTRLSNDGLLFPRDLWGNASTMWILDEPDSAFAELGLVPGLRAYSRATTTQRQANNDIEVGAIDRSRSGVTGHGNTIYLLTDSHIRAWSTAGVRMAGSDIEHGLTDPSACFHDGETLWVAASGRARPFDPATGELRALAAIPTIGSDTAGLGFTTAWSDGEPDDGAEVVTVGGDTPLTVRQVWGDYIRRVPDPVKQQLIDDAIDQINRAHAAVEAALDALARADAAYHAAVAAGRPQADLDRLASRAQAAVSAFFIALSAEATAYENLEVIRNRPGNDTVLNLTGWHGRTTRVMEFFQTATGFHLDGSDHFYAIAANALVAVRLPLTSVR